MGVKQIALHEVRSGHKSTAVAYNTEQHIQIIGVDTTGGVVTITLSTGMVVAGSVIIVKDEGGNAGTNNITVDTEGSETIDGAATDTISSNFGSQGYYNDGANWFKV